MAVRISDDGIQEWIESLGEVPAFCISHSARNLLCQVLNITSENPSVCSSEQQQDWIGLAQLMGFDYGETELFRMKPNPTMEILNQWERKHGVTVRTLMSFLLKLERFDILENDVFRKCIEKDVQRDQERRSPVQDPGAGLKAEKDKSHNETHSASRTAEKISNLLTLSKVMEKLGSMQIRHHAVTSNSTKVIKPLDDWNEHPGRESDILVTSDVGVPPEDRIIFDAFVTYADGDFDFVVEMTKQLESEKYGLKLCVIGRDLLGGGSEHTVTAKLIQERCKRVVIVVSKEFHQSSACDFQVKFAQHLSPGSQNKKLIPVLLSDLSDIPPILQHITVLHYGKSHIQEWFWERLGKSLQIPIKDDLESTANLEKVLLTVNDKSHSSFFIKPSSSVDTQSSDSSECVDSSTTGKANMQNSSESTQIESNRSEKELDSKSQVKKKNKLSTLFKSKGKTKKAYLL